MPKYIKIGQAILKLQSKDVQGDDFFNYSVHYK